MKQFRVVITDTSTGEQHVHDLEALAILGIRERNDEGVESMLGALHIQPQEVATLAGALLDNMPDCTCSKCSSERELDEELDKVAEHLASVFEKMLKSKGDDRS